MTPNHQVIRRPGTLRALIAIVLTVLALPFSPARALTPAPHLWSQRFGSASTDRGQAVAVDGADNLFVAGYFSGTADFGGGNLVSAGLSDVFLAKYDPAGAHQWSLGFGSTAGDEAYAVALDASGSVIVAGSFQGTVNFGGGNLVSAGSRDIFLAKYGPTGAHVWSKRFGGTSSDQAYGVAVDGSGNIIVTGYFGNTVNFGGGNLVSGGSDDIFLARYDSNGIHQWSQGFGTTWPDLGYSVAVDALDQVIVTGFFGDTVNFGGGNLVSAGTEDIFVAKYSSAGAHQWSQRFGGFDGDYGRSVAVDASNNVFVTGRFLGSVNFGGGNLGSSGSEDAFVASYDAAGVHRWSRRFGGASYDEGFAVAVDGPGSVLVTGVISGTVNLGSGDLVSAGGTDIVFAMYDAAGTHAWSRRFGSTSNDFGMAVTRDGSDHPILTGSFVGTANFGGDNLVSVGGSDFFLARYAEDPAEPVITAVTDIGNDQGRNVRIRFHRSGHDQVGSTAMVLAYEAYRRDDAPPMSPARIDPAGLTGPELLDDGWTQVGVVAAHGQASYGIDVPTIGDSTVALGPYDSVFHIRAATASPYEFFDSPPDSGHSLDNLTPEVPAGLFFSGGRLSWDESTAPDFDHYTVYGSATGDFASAAALDDATAASLDVSAASYDYYFVTVTDVSGNESSPAVISAQSGPAGDDRARLALQVKNDPNPFRARTTVSYAVPSPGRVTVAVYDLRGARVATLVDGEERDAGAFSVEWNGHVDSGAAAPSGVYFLRVEHGGAVRSKSVMVLR